MFKTVFILFLVLSLSAISYAEEDMMIKLPEPRLKGEVSLEETIEKRRSERSLSGKDLTLEQISQLLWSCQGLTNDRGFRAAPSAGAIYPLEIYLLSKDGLFQYLPASHSIKRIKNKDLRGELCDACLGQPFVRSAAIDIVMCAEFERTTGRYGKRGENYVYIEIGHAAQNVHLQAVAEGLGSVPVGAFSKDGVAKVLGLSEKLVPVYVIPVGYIE
ncbi:MAG: SagB/ThcOx family dehydrogenase [Candidatus Omnitrophica bacterium]|nr:SagB/ThcOx family dehydrogenase [Candidatus Omnitrophota bacterium]MBU4457326.1 SagB/ThcOx family dehydrogenase [Candidatus Omnitrophota bacterium]